MAVDEDIAHIVQVASTTRSSVEVTTAILEFIQKYPGYSFAELERQFRQIESGLRIKYGIENIFIPIFISAATVDEAEAKFATPVRTDLDSKQCKYKLWVSTRSIEVSLKERRQWSQTDEENLKMLEDTGIMVIKDYEETFEYATKSKRIDFVPGGFKFLKEEARKQDLNSRVENL
jgi:hypothetical protein